MKEQKKKRKWWIFFLVVLLLSVVAVATWIFYFDGWLQLGRVAMKEMKIVDKITNKIESGELPEKIELPKEVIEELTSLEQESESESKPKFDFKPKASQKSTIQSGGGVDYSQGIDLSYAAAIASVASGADISAAYSAVLGCLSSADKAQIKAYLKNGQEGAAYQLVASRLTGDAYATLAGLYYKYLPMVQ